MQRPHPPHLRQLLADTIARCPCLQPATVEDTAEPLETPGQPAKSNAAAEPADGRHPQGTQEEGVVSPHAGMDHHSAMDEAAADAGFSLLMQVGLGVKV